MWDFYKGKLDTFNTWLIALYFTILFHFLQYKLPGFIHKIHYTGGCTYRSPDYQYYLEIFFMIINPIWLIFSSIAVIRSHKNTVRKFPRFAGQTIAFLFFLLGIFEMYYVLAQPVIYGFIASLRFFKVIL